MATFLWRVAGSPTPESGENIFADVPADSWYAQAVQWAYGQKITNGTGGGKFSPDAICTRAQICLLYTSYVMFSKTRQAAVSKPEPPTPFC